MTRVVVVCEGQTEEEFVRTVLAPAFVGEAIYLEGQTIETSRGHKGGGLSYERVKNHVRNTLSQKNIAAVTTFLDLYRLDTQFPRFEEAREKNELDQKLDVLCDGLRFDILHKTNYQPNRFIPYIQSDEFEAVLFSDVNITSTHEVQWHNKKEYLQNIRDKYHTPEYIKNPAYYLEKQLHHPDYKKRRHGPVIAQKIGLYKIKNECPFFAKWLEQIRQLAST